MNLSKGAKALIKKQSFRVRRAMNKKLYKRRYNARKGLTTISLPKGLPDRMRTKLVYSDISDYVNLTAPTYNTSRSFAMSNLVDPDITNTGAQPPLFDNLKLLYNRWRVNSCKITCTVENIVNFPAMITLVGLYSAGTNSPTIPLAASTYDIRAMSEFRKSKTARLATVQVGNGNVKTISKTFKPSDFVGKEYWSSVNYSGEGDTAPISYPIIALIINSCEPSVSSAIACFVSWSIEYDVTFYQGIETEVAAYD